MIWILSKILFARFFLYQDQSVLPAHFSYKCHRKLRKYYKKYITCIYITKMQLYLLRFLLLKKWSFSFLFLLLLKFSFSLFPFETVLYSCFHSLKIIFSFTFPVFSPLLSNCPKSFLSFSPHLIFYLFLEIVFVSPFPPHNWFFFHFPSFKSGLFLVVVLFAFL